MNEAQKGMQCIDELPLLKRWLVREFGEARLTLVDHHVVRVVVFRGKEYFDRTLPEGDAVSVRRNLIREAMLRAEGRRGRRRPLPR